MKTGVCEKCGRKGFVNKHHIYPKCSFGKDSKYTILCLDCHDEIEVIYNIFEENVVFKKRNILLRREYKYIFYNWLNETLWRKEYEAEMD
jgi:hypothetical protein